MVIDGGWHDPDGTAWRPGTRLPWQWLTDVTASPSQTACTIPRVGAELHPYAGHGTFIAGIVQCRRADMHGHVS